MASEEEVEQGSTIIGTEDNNVEQSSSSSSTNSSLGTMRLNQKAGMSGIDVDKLSQIIEQTSKGSKFYEHKKNVQAKLDVRIAQMQAKVTNLTDDQIREAEKEVAKTISQLERERDLTRVICHIDMDCFFAAVEMRDRPELANVPLAVGGNSMLSTSNYIARKYGVRAAMPGFIAKKLCPNLVIVPSNFKKYIEVSNQVQEIFQEYDQNFSGMSLDEAYLDITDYLLTINLDKSEPERITAEEVLREIRAKILEKTKLTASAGIAPNGMLAKIAGDICKPDNQLRIEANLNVINSFIQPLPIRKVSGIGNVTEQLLKGIGVSTCSEIYDKRGIIHLLFGPSTSSFLLATSMGIGNTYFSKDSGENESRKSISCERTFKDTGDLSILKDRIKNICVELNSHMIRSGIRGRTLTVKIKSSDFQVKTIARSLLGYTNDTEEMFNIAMNILNGHLSQNKSLQVRLVGVRMSTLKSKEDKNDKDEEKRSFSNSQPRIDVMVAKQKSKEAPTLPCPICSKLFISEREVSSHIDKCLEDTEESEIDGKIEMVTETTPEASTSFLSTTKEVSFKRQFICPICSQNIDISLQSEDISDQDFENLCLTSHVESCLTKQSSKDEIKHNLHLGHSSQKKEQSVQMKRTKGTKKSLPDIRNHFIRLDNKNSESTSPPAKRRHIEVNIEDSD